MIIQKFPIKITENQEINMPAEAQILAIQMLGDQLAMWANVNPSFGVPKETRHIQIIGTEIPIHEGRRRYINTVQTHDGSIVWHIFERL